MFAATAFGHAAFKKCLFWIERERERENEHADYKEVSQESIGDLNEERTRTQLLLERRVASKPRELVVNFVNKKKVTKRTEWLHNSSCNIP